MAYEVVFDNGKPYTETFNTDEELEEGLKNFYIENKDDDYPFNAHVYRDGEDITESQFIDEMITGLMFEVNQNEM